MKTNTCECADHACSAHTGKDCTAQATQTLTRVDFAGTPRVAFCDACASDAMESGVFGTDEDEPEDFAELDAFRKLPATIERAKALRANWRKFESFGWHGRPDDADAFGIVYTHNRDSGLLEQSNAEAIAKAMRPFLGVEDESNKTQAMEEDHNHWACGWVKGYAIRCLDEDGNATRAVATWFQLQDRIANYPLLDEEDHSQKEYDATLENIRQCAHGLLCDDAREGWEGEAFSWFWENEQSEVENHDGNGGYPDGMAMRRCLVALALLDEDEARDDEREAMAEVKRERARNQPGQRRLEFPS